ncbi:MAG: dihydropteroate synthase [Anaerolineae bacterium]
MNRYNMRLVRIDSVADYSQRMLALGVDPRGAAIMSAKGQFYVFQAEKLSFAAASILKQEMLAKGGDAALSGEVYRGGEHTTDTLICGTVRTLHQVIHNLAIQPLPSMQQLSVELKQALQSVQSSPSTTLALANLECRWGQRTYVMGILNVTPDSFSGDGLLGTASGEAPPVEHAVRQGLAMEQAGADILDVGGESTRPGSRPVDAATELERILPVIRGIRAVSSIAISVDTTKAGVAAAALDAGANLVNDVSGLQGDPEMAPLLAGRNAPVVIMHRRLASTSAVQVGQLGGHFAAAQTDNPQALDTLLAEIIRDLRCYVDQALQAGIARERIIIDPGIGFGKARTENLYLINHLDELRSLGLPVLLGPSRKAFIGYTLGLPVTERVEGTAAAVAVGIMRGADIIRVHDVAQMVRVARMTDALVRPDSVEEG